MSKPHIFVLLLVLNSLNIVTPQPPTEPTHVDETCDDKFEDKDYDPDSEHTSNVRALMLELKNQAFKTSFYNTSIGSGENKVYGQYYCRGDIDSNLCGKCIQQAGNNICVGGIYAVVWYEECTLRHDNVSMVGIYNTDSTYLTSNQSTIKVTDTNRFDIVLNSTLDRIIREAVSGFLNFAVGEGEVSETETLYCLVQCSPDLNARQCDTCLRSESSLCRASTTFTAMLAGSTQFWVSWMSMFSTSCQLRYSNHGAFYHLSNAPPASPELPHGTAAKGKSASYYVVRAVIPAIVVGLLTILAISFCLIRRNKPNTDVGMVVPLSLAGTAEIGEQTIECVHFDLKTIESSTNCFSMSNKLGQGGFGIVYQGLLSNGQDIAVKRLSKNSGQGTKEFKTEVEVLANLQHKNLVQLVGCCIDGEERLLVYEFMHNLSLDRFLFDATRSAYLTWAIRHKIILGIARGLHYLHEDSRIKIVHRDLKTSNVLLDNNLDPKLADFGMARLVKVDQSAGNTSRIVGTYGYMSPEYALAGRYSTKSDVYSFGIIVLEILSGKNNSLFYDISHSEGLLQHAWRAWNGGAIEQLIDPVLQNNYSRIEVERCLQIGLLCVQDDAANRPTMHAVLVMLNSNAVDLPPPISPSHYNYINKFSSDEETQESTSKKQEHVSSLSSTAFSLEKDLHAR